MTKIHKKAEQKNCSAQPKNKSNAALTTGPAATNHLPNKTSIAAELPRGAPRPGSQLAFFNTISETQNGKKAATLQLSCANVSRPKPCQTQKNAKTPQFDGFGNLTENSSKTLEKRAKAKTFTNAFIFKLINLKSPLEQPYRNTYYCSSTLIQSSQKITASFCGNRWCLICNRIRTAKLIIAYRDILESFPEKQFVTLTIPNILGNHTELRASFIKMTNALRKIQNTTLRQRGTYIQGLRKLECTYNPFRGDFNQHLHLIVANLKQAQDLVTEWLKTFPNANPKAQDIRQADDKSVKELFKYFTKIISQGKNRHIYPTALDTIFQAMRNLRTFQPMGITKQIPENIEDIDELQAEIYHDLAEQEKIWQWIDHDWIDRSTGEVLTDYTPSKEFQEFLKEINS